MHTLVDEAKDFSDALAYIAATANADRGHTPVIALGLGMVFEIVDELRGAGQQHVGAIEARQGEYVVIDKEAGFGICDWKIVPIRRGWAKLLARFSSPQA
jgi:hypothetical protein